jgi:hypothetical protein
MKCKFDPTKPPYNTAPIGMFHCPECGEMVVANVPHPNYEKEGDNLMFDHLKQLVNCQVVGIACDDEKETIAEYGEPLYGLILLTKDNTVKIAIIMSDPEGNSPGFLAIREFPNHKLIKGE